MNQMRYSRLEDHNRYQSTDELYNPLRSVLMHPQIAASHRQLLNPAAMQSRVTHDYALLSNEEAENLRQHTYIPIDRPLRPTHNLQKVRNNQFMVVDAQERVVGAPISVEEMERIKNQGLKQEKIVWDFADEAQRPPPQIISPPVPIVDPRPPTIKEPVKSSYRSPPIEDYKPKDKYKYNLYSMIDEPANMIKESGCHACTCPGNEIIASRTDPQSLKWFK